MLPAVKVENLWKEYVVGQAVDRHATFYDTLSNALKAPFKKRDESLADSTKFWALNDVSFEVQPGEVVGIIGRNGAGKSTLLKILSRITAPTKGRVEVRGRLASLLEVGTGFHPELSGRENIFLNGAILGMTRRDIAKKFDEIVAFAEVEKFIDTPVKRYSSGMYVRLAFGVAAHLDPDILIVDEVLAVGDLQFQKKCLGKMSDVAAEGRTVLFVSHNLQAVKLLCQRAVALHAGAVVDKGTSGQVVSGYMARSQPATNLLWIPPSPIGTGQVQLAKFEVIPGGGAREMGGVSSDKAITVSLSITVLSPVLDLCVGFDLIDDDGTTVLRSFQTDLPQFENANFDVGEYVFSARIPPGLLNRGAMQIAPRIGIHNREWFVNIDPVVRFETTLNHGQTKFWASLDRGERPGVIAPLLPWVVKSLVKSHSDIRESSALC